MCAQFAVIYIIDSYLIMCIYKGFPSATHKENTAITILLGFVKFRCIESAVVSLYVFELLRGVLTISKVASMLSSLLFHDSLKNRS